MANLQTLTINDTGFLGLPVGTTAQRPVSPAAGYMRYNTDFSEIELFNGSIWINTVSGIIAGAGLTSATAANSAQDILLNNPNSSDGVYWINLPTVGATQIYCVMNRAWDGGGWMMAMKATRANTFEFSSNYWTATNTLNPTQTNQNDGDAKFNTFNYFQGRDLLARWPDITTGGGSISGLDVWFWLQNSFPQYISQSSSTLVNLFNTADRAFIGDAKLFSGWGTGGTPFSSQTDVRFYGFNYRNNQTLSNGTRTRWGFGWNENGGGLFPNGNMDSDDVAGGIGLNGLQQNTTLKYSAGDIIGCCQDRTGINRSARVEMYVR